MSETNAACQVIDGLANAVLTTVLSKIRVAQAAGDDADFDHDAGRQRAYEQRLLACTTDQQRQQVLNRMESLSLAVPPPLQLGHKAEKVNGRVLGGPGRRNGNGPVVDTSGVDSEVSQ